MPIISYWIELNWIEKGISYKSYHSILSLQMCESVSLVRTTNKRTRPIVPTYILPYSDRHFNFYGRWNGIHDKRERKSSEIEYTQLHRAWRRYFPPRKYFEAAHCCMNGDHPPVTRKALEQLDFFFFNWIPRWSYYKKKNSEINK